MAKSTGIQFETEADFSKFCLVNDAVYIAKFADGEHAGEWTATGAQFAVPYVFKKLFSKKPIVFEDMCETKSASTSLYLDMNETLTVNEDAEQELANRLKLSECKVDEVNDYIAYIDPTFMNVTTKELARLIEKGHNRIFIGKVGQFCPIKPGCGGGVLLRQQGEKFNAAGGTKGYRWLESEMVRELGKENDIDKSYYNALCDDAIKTISKYGDFDMFVAND